MARERSRARNVVEAAAAGGLEGFFRALPFPVAEALGRGLARAVFPLTSRRALVTRNLARAFPEKSPGEIAGLRAQVFAHVGGLAAELLHFQGESLESFRQRHTVVGNGIERLRAAASSGRGVLITTPHFGNWEMGALAFGPLGFPVTVVVRPLDNPILDAKLTAFRERFGNRVLPKASAAREILRVLKAGGFVGILPDQHAHPPDAVVAPFFGRPASTTSAIARLADKTEALIVPAWDIRVAPGRYELHIEEPIDVRTLPREERSAEALMTRVNAVLESVIRRSPEQWLWLHNRWRLD